MKLRWPFALFLCVGVLLDVDGSPTYGAAVAQCRRTCPPSWRRDDAGCCLGPPEAEPTTSVRRCPEGQHRSAGHCCPDGSDWVPAQRRCICTQPPCGEAPAEVAPPAERPVQAPAFACPAGASAVPGGSFWMGSVADEGEDDEQPSHEVTVASFCMDTQEVSVGRYVECMRAGRCTPPASTIQVQGWSAQAVGAMSAYCNGTREDRADHPVNCVTWAQASAYCAWRGGRLPTEAQWEYAARGNGRRLYPWGSDLPDGRRVNACGDECERLPIWGRGRVRGLYDQDDGWEATSPVTAFARGRTASGLLNLAGNVWEWTADYYGAYPSGAVTDPTGPASGTFRVARGGAWTTRVAPWIRAAARNRVRPDDRNSDLGFRCVHAPGASEGGAR